MRHLANVHKLALTFGVVGAVILLPTTEIVEAQPNPHGATRYQRDIAANPIEADHGLARATTKVTGDFNGDGHLDLALGSSNADVTFLGVEYFLAGAVRVFYGTPEGIGDVPDLFLHEGVAGGGLVGNERFGEALASGDFNADGRDDLAIGAQLDGASGMSSAGAVIVLNGGDLGLVTPGTVWHQGTPSVNGALEANDHFGASLAAGDFDGPSFDVRGFGQSYDDLAIGVPGEDVNIPGEGNITNAGAVNVLYGGPGGLSAVGDQIFTLDNLGLETSGVDQFGEVLLATNFNGGLYDDLAIGIPGASPSGESNAGMVVVLMGGLDGVSTTPQVWHQDVPGISQSSDAYDRFGSELASADFDGDGYQDLAVGVPGEENVENLAGAIHTIFGGPTGLDSIGQEIITQNLLADLTPEFQDNFGGSLAAGDFNADGTGDLAVGIPREDLSDGARFQRGGGPPPIYGPGAVYVLHGSDAGLWPVSTEAPGMLLHQDTPGMPGDAEFNDRFGNELVAGNFSGTAGTDLVISIFADFNASTGLHEGSLIFVPSAALFLDGFESGDETAWTLSTP